MRTLIMMDGGHTTILQDVTPRDVEFALLETMHTDEHFAYFSSGRGERGVNAFAVDPKKVVALVKC